MATSPGRYRLPAEAGALLALYAELHAATDGRLSPLVGAALGELGYGPRLAGHDPGAPVPRFEDALTWDGEDLHLLSPAILDVGAAGKGQLVDLVSELLDEAGVVRRLVDASGDLRAAGVPELRIALEHPGDATRAVGIATPGDRALCASATNRRRWDGHHHVLDAVTGRPVAGVVATWAVADNALLADGAASALFVDVDPAFLHRHRVEHARLFADGRFEVSPGFPGEVFA